MTPSSSPMPRPALPAANLLQNGASTFSSPYSTLVGSLASLISVVLPKDLVFLFFCFLENGLSDFFKILFALLYHIFCLN